MKYFLRKYTEDTRFTNALVLISQKGIKKRVLYKAELETRSIK